MDSSKVRIDRWLWAVRVFRTRSAAIEACRAGHVKISGERVKPAREVRIGEVLSVQIGKVTRTFRVLTPLERRVGAKLVQVHREDLTPAEDDAKQREREAGPRPVRDRGLGRPTKRDRRLLEQFLDLPADPGDDD